MFTTFQVRLVFGLLLLLEVSSQNSQKDEDEGRPYEFSFTIDGEQHRYEKKDVNGIVQGEFGFITGDGIYHVTVYATDENGSFKILSMKNTRISEPLDKGGKPSTTGLVRQPSQQGPTGQIASLIPVQPTAPSSTTPRSIYDFTTGSTIRVGCSSCGIVTKPPPGPLKFQNPLFQTPSKENGKPSPSAAAPVYGNKPLAQPVLLPNSIPAPKPPTPPVQPPTYPGLPAPPPVKPPSNPTQPPSPVPQAIPTGLISKPISPTGQPTSYPSITSGPSVPAPRNLIQPRFNNNEPPSQNLLAPGTNPGPASNKNPTEQNPFGPNQPIPIQPPKQIPSTPQNLIRNERPKQPDSVLSKVTVDGGVIKVPGRAPIPIQDKYPNMVDGLPPGMKESDISELLYKFNYTVGFHGHYEKGLKDGSKVGGYFVNGRDGISRVVTYVADENGYRPKVRLVNLGLDSEDTPKPDSEKRFGLKNFEFVWYPVN